MSEKTIKSSLSQKQKELVQIHILKNTSGILLMKKTTFILLGILITNLWATQAVAQEVEMADTLRQDGKIWVVVAVITVVFAGIIAYLVSLDRKIGKLENKIK
jgi:uncharacterized membrane protein YidH (DUF202 family)